MAKHFTGYLQKVGDKLVYKKESDQTKYQNFVNKLDENAVVEVYMEFQSDDGTLAQLAKIHTMIRELASHIGETFETMKLIVKKRAGLCVIVEIDGQQFIECKSLGKCNKQELALCIEAIREIGGVIDYPIH